MIRHASFDHPAMAIPSLSISMIEPPFRALLVPAVGAAALPEPGVPLTGETAVALTAIATGAKKKFSAAFAVAANPSSETIIRCRHAHWQAALDNGSLFVTG